MSANPRPLLEDLESQVFDIVVIGGGIIGAGIAREASGSGLKTLLLEKGDFASGTSSKSGKLIHGGIRYLSQGHLKLVIDSVSERHTLRSRVAPHLVKPIQFFKPLYHSNRNGKWLVIFGLFFYHLFAWFRDYKGFRILSTSQMTAFESNIKTNDSAGAVSFFDCMALDYRLTLDTLKSAHENGATLLNYCEVKNIKLDKKEPNQVVFQQSHNSGQKKIRARVVINAAGAWADDILDKVQIKNKFGLKLSKGIHLVVSNKKLSIAHAIGFEGKGDQRDIYALPMRDRVLIGTTDTFCQSCKDNLGMDQKDVTYLLDSINQIFPNSHLTNSDVLVAYAGVRPLIGSDKDKAESSVSRDFEIKIESEGFASITGGKLTTFRQMSHKLMGRVKRKFFAKTELKKFDSRAPISGGTPISLNTNQQEVLASQIGINDSTVSHLIDFYGSNFDEILGYVREDINKGQPICDDLPHIWAEIDYFVDCEWAKTLNDVMQRRAMFFLLGENNGRDLSPKIAGYMGKLLGWSDEEIVAQVQAYENTIFAFKKAL